MPSSPTNLNAAPALAGGTSPGASGMPLPDDVRAFSRNNGLDDHLGKAVDLAGRTFAPVERLEVELRQDRETADEWIVLRVVVRADRVNVPAARQKYTAEWVASVPSPQRYRIRLSPDVV
jgi:hypothetical protein